MGHMVNFLSFKESTSRKTIERECSEWCTENADWGETGGSYRRANVQFTSRLFDDYKEAEDFLDRKSGNYDSIAVKYKEYKTTKPSAALKTAQAKLQKLNEKREEYRKPHYSNVKSKTVTCKCCKAILPTEYCGRTFHNNCPVCNTDLRPQSTLDAIKKLDNDIKAAELKVKEATKEQQAKAKYDVKWLVLVEVHC